VDAVCAFVNCRKPAGDHQGYWDLPSAVRILGAIINTEAKMLRAILAALANGFRKAAGYAFGVIMLPFRLFMPSAVPARPRLDVEALKAQMRGPGVKPSELVQSHVRDSVVAWSWISGCINDRCTRTLPSQMSKRLSTWVVGLNYTQLMKLKTAGPQGVFEHASGKNVIAGVPPVGPLTPVEVRYPPAPKDTTAPRLVRKVA
jgi:hypothetical protein